MARNRETIDFIHDLMIVTDQRNFDYHALEGVLDDIVDYGRNTGSIFIVASEKRFGFEVNMYYRHDCNFYYIGFGQRNLHLKLSFNRRTEFTFFQDWMQQLCHFYASMQRFIPTEDDRNALHMQLMLDDMQHINVQVEEDFDDRAVVDLREQNLEELD